MLELDVGVTKDGKVVVSHDTTRRPHDERPRARSRRRRCKQIRRLDAAYWFSHGAATPTATTARSAYRFRGLATGKRKPPKGFKRADFRVPTLREVLRAFPRTPINIEIKGRTPDGGDRGVRPQRRGARAAARAARSGATSSSSRSSSRRSTASTSSRRAMARRARRSTARRRACSAAARPATGVVAFQLPITYEFGGQTLDVTTAENVARAHARGLRLAHLARATTASRPATWRTLIDWCVDGVMTARPVAFERMLREHAPRGLRLTTATSPFLPDLLTDAVSGTRRSCSPV